MKIVRIIGGLGNQLFQYAMLVGLKKHSGDEVKIDLSAMQGYALHNGFELKDIFNISAQIATKEEVKSLGRYYINYRHWQICHHLFPKWRKEFVERKFTKFYNEVLTEASKNRIYDGYWQCYKYFEDARNEILKEYTYRNNFDAKNAMLADKMLADKNSVSIHIRRGDYLKSKIYKGICELEYYDRAIKVMKSHLGANPNVYIFSNDQTWCRENISQLLSGANVTFVDWNTGRESYNDMRLMHYCRMNIIAASSFSWWGAYLNQREDQIVVAPKVWINMDLEYDIQLPNWITI